MQDREWLDNISFFFTEDRHSSSYKQHLAPGCKQCSVTTELSTYRGINVLMFVKLSLVTLLPGRWIQRRLDLAFYAKHNGHVFYYDIESGCIY